VSRPLRGASLFPGPSLPGGRFFLGGLGSGGHLLLLFLFRLALFLFLLGVIILEAILWIRFGRKIDLKLKFRLFKLLVRPKHIH
jgi:hypothetical protein